MVTSDKTNDLVDHHCLCLLASVIRLESEGSRQQELKVLTLAIHLLVVGTGIRRVGLVTARVHVLAIVVLYRLLYAGRRWCRIRLLLRRITDRRQLNLARARVRSRRLVSIGLCLLAVLLGCSLSLALPLLFGLSLDFLLLLTLLPLFANLFEFCDKMT